MERTDKLLWSRLVKKNFFANIKISLKNVFQSAFENLEVIEDTRVGSRIVSIDIEDPDLTGMALSVNCTPSPQVCWTLDDRSFLVVISPLLENSEIAI